MESNKEFSHSLDFNKEVMAEDLLIKSLPTSLVSEKTPSLRSSISSMSSKDFHGKVRKFPKIKIFKPKRTVRKDYKLSLDERPLSTKTVNRILFKEIINEKSLKCPCKKFDNSFCCFTARDWLNTAFELGYRPTNTSRVHRKFEYQEKKDIYDSLIKGIGSYIPSANSAPTFSINYKLSKCKVQIIKDIPRTFGNIDIFNYVSMLQQLYRIMTSYFVYDPELGYTQGMNLLVGALLMHCEESVAFWLFITLIEDYEMREVFKDSYSGVQQHCHVIKHLIDIYLPKVSQHFEFLGVEVEMFASSWILSLF